MFFLFTRLAPGSNVDQPPSPPAVGPLWDCRDIKKTRCWSMTFPHPLPQNCRQKLLNKKSSKTFPRLFLCFSCLPDSLLGATSISPRPRPPSDRFGTVETSKKRGVGV